MRTNFATNEESMNQESRKAGKKTAPELYQSKMLEHGERGRRRADWGGITTWEE
jgi:hypothetical protein